MPKSTSFLGSLWFRIFCIGVILFVGTDFALRITGNPNYFPTVLLVGALIVPITFTTYFYDRERRIDLGRHQTSPLSITVSGFVIGGVIGLIVAGVLEFSTMRHLNVSALFGVAAIEETAKLIFPVFVLWRGRYRSEIDGLLFGVASGMGFAALETMGYGMVALIRSGGDLGSLEQLLLVRGLFSPAGHAAWTGLVCAVLWRERQQSRLNWWNWKIITAFITAVVLHALWNLTNSLGGVTTTSFLGAIGGNLVVAGISLALLIRRLRESKQRPPVQHEAAADHTET